MGGILLAFHDESVADFLPDDLDLDDAPLIIDIVEDPIITEPQFLAGNGVRPHFFDTAGSVGRLMAEMDLQAVDDHSPCIGGQRPQMGFGSFGQKDCVGLGHPWLCSRSDAMPPLSEPSTSYDHSFYDTAIFEALKRGRPRKARARRFLKKRQEKKVGTPSASDLWSG
jgi:hypothetical protein